eukprot:5504964-Amphidinium_carterae.4
MATTNTKSDSKYDDFEMLLSIKRKPAEERALRAYVGAPVPEHVVSSSTSWSNSPRACVN